MSALPRAAWYELPGVVGVSGNNDEGAGDNGVGDVGKGVLGRGGSEGTGGTETLGRDMFAPNDTERRPDVRGKLTGESLVKSKEDNASDFTDLVEGPMVELLTLPEDGHPSSSRPRPVSDVSV